MLCSPTASMTHTNDPISNGRAPKSDRLNSGRFLVNVTANFITTSLVLAALVAFLIGSAAHINLSSKLYSRPSLSTSPSNQPNHGGTTINKQTLLPRIGLCGDEGCNAEEGAEQILLASDAKYPSSKLGDEERDNDAGINNYTYAPHLPSGQHLLVDARDVNSGFLNSDERIVTAMLGLTEECKIALLSYHCLSHVPVGVSCYGVSSEGHVSIRTWPEEGVIIIDLFKCGTSPPLIQVLPIIKKLFVIPSHDLVEESGGDLQEPTIIWSYKLRGFREGFYGYRRYDNPLETDLGLDLLRMHYLAMKEVLVSEETDFQHVDIYELINPRRTSMASYKRSLSGDGSYESLHPEIYRPDKILFLDGVQQSSLYGEAAYHEALVHPSMITHPNPRRVAIIGGGEGATLREVLKHNTVKEAVMVEIDGELVDMCRGHLIEWCDCTDLVGSDANLCFDDSRASVLIEDAFAWFIDNFGGSTKKRELFDVIIMDALDPDKFVEIVGELYKSDQFVRSLYNGLADEGVFVVQIGESQHIDDTALEVGQLKDTAHMIEALRSVGFKSMHTYDEGHSGYFAPWSYLVCFKNSKSRASWYETSAGIEIKLRQRMHRTKSGEPSLIYFDAPTMIRYQLPPRSDETVYCRKALTPKECKDDYNGTNPKLVNPVSLLEAHKEKGISIHACHNQPSTVHSPVFERHSRQLLGSGC